MELMLSRSVAKELRCAAVLGLAFGSCENGLHVKPRAGDGLLFWNVLSNGTVWRCSLKPVERVLNSPSFSFFLFHASSPNQGASHDDLNQSSPQFQADRPQSRQDLRVDGLGLTPKTLEA
jgi:hypothetical protein